MSEMPPSSYTPPPPGGGSYTPPPPPPPPIGGPTGPTGPASSDRTLMLVLSYLWFLSLIPLTQKKDDPEVQWHAKNGFVMAIVSTACSAIVFIVGMFSSMLAMALSCINCFIGLAYLIFTIICIMKALSGQRYRVPVLTDYAEKM
jgi:uncharacterized membrane protein